ncbi:MULTISPECIES: lysophospholipid acyltransferase family protein [Gordonia]|uniref:1-acyl-sn-glycerol-3-phosphate acyltransferase n=2 Tax=Gordonia TaxID=2053 RepID=A0ABN3HXX2_9ACTN|nr:MULTISPECIES: lysophospholipid acyltransferase family protein [Gordonia]AUH67382.1 1-acyl-sn-glycerol-3-phosphate acyltransferase [Gordonia sp. YC-JH1]KJR08249.1 acyltransferase [Gordonia sihwensis]KXT56102.1 acyltransferase [Gordonia sp. QH-12]MBY4570437.1 1-acyl-sn-glycerol-3-phosphate acyltransferase [Gordonia sihwensis]WFN92984.1 lysophospholipid acyltransferase family protein [Gordonia sihwensis]
MEPVYAGVVSTARLLWLAQGLKFDISGVENMPAHGPGVVAINHTGYLDFTFAGIPAFLQKPRRYVRFMAKKEVFDNAVGGPIMRSLKHIPVDRANGAQSYRDAVDYLKRGELVGVYPEATISRSFELKEFKSGAARMSLESGAPIIPTIIWGAQRIWTKGHPRQLGRTGFKIMVGVGEPLRPEGTPEELTQRLFDSMRAKLTELQDGYGEYPAGEFWVPAARGGGAPTLEEANAMDRADAEAKAAKRARREASGDAD